MEIAELVARLDRAKPVEELPGPEVCKQLREQAGVTRQLAASVLGVSDSTLALWECGEHAPRLRHERRWRCLVSALRSTAGV